MAIAIPAHGAPVVSPPGSLGDKTAAAIAAHAAAVAGEGSEVPPTPPSIADAVPVRIGDQVVGIVAASAGGTPADRLAWLEAAAAAASVTALIRETPGPDSADALVAQVAAGPLDDLPGVLARARRLGVDLSMGAAALSARFQGPPPIEVAALNGRAILVAELRPGRLVALSAASDDALAGLAALAETLRAGGMAVAVSAPRRDPALLHEAIREAAVLAELTDAEQCQPGGHDETYRLLIGVLLRDRKELAQLRDSTVASLADYDARHDTDLLDTLRAFLNHDGSTTDTADALALHRHTVGYRLARVHEVSGLSPYESDGRERLSLGLKARQILDVEQRLDGG
ncbi:MAG TPA: helix-turn-helix domain-containing protein [Solirubrobacteraceae bacterium]|nr:helix-turn-helix domain-containing protein [Solirubrobacteraceae bacterium]